MLNETACCLDALVADVLGRVGVCGPPVDARHVARELGATIARDNRQTQRARLVRHTLGKGSCAVSILVRHDPRAERMQWSIAHEIGESLAAEAFERLDWDARAATPGLREQVANQLANRLLLPREWFAPDAAHLRGDLVALKVRYRTASHELIARRLLDFPPQAITTIFDQGRLTRRLGNLPGCLPSLLPCEQVAQQRAFRRGKLARRSQEGATCRAWAIHEPTWKREILRTEFTSDWE